MPAAANQAHSSYGRRRTRRSTSTSSRRAPPIEFDISASTSTGKEVDYDDIVKGHDLGGGDYLIVTGEELEDVEPGRSRTIDITNGRAAHRVDERDVGSVQLP